MKAENLERMGFFETKNLPKTSTIALAYIRSEAGCRSKKE